MRRCLRMKNAAARMRATPARTPITIPAMAPLERCCDDDATEEEEADVEAAVVAVTCAADPVLVVDCTTATPRAKPSYG